MPVAEPPALDVATGPVANHHAHDPEGLELIFCVAVEWLPGMHTTPEEPGIAVRGVDSASWTIDQWEAAGAVSQLSHAEQVYVLRHRIVLSRTFSMQQSDFERHSIPVVRAQAGNLVVLLEEHQQIVGLGTADRYNIFGPATPEGVIREPVSFEDVADWQAGDYSWRAYRAREIEKAAKAAGS